MILVTGANGNLGSLTIESLLTKNPSADVIGLVRSEEKGARLKENGIEIRVGDYTDYESIEKALDGISILLLISTSTMQDRAGQHRHVIEAAIEEGISQIFYSSIVQADKLLSPLSPDHNKTEEMLKQSGIPYTIFRNTFYTEFFPMYIGDALETGEWVFPSNGKKVNFAYRSEMAEALANALSTPRKHQNMVFEITSAKAYTLEKLAAVMSDAAGKEIRYKDISVASFREGLKKAGLPDDVTAMSTMVAETFVNGALDYTSDDLESLLGRKPKGTAEFVKEHLRSQ